MKIYKLHDFVGGWVVGNFLPSIYKTPDFEICYKIHSKGEHWPIHFHKVGTEINILIRGQMMLQNRRLIEGDVFVIEPWEIANPEFLEDCELIIIKIPSAPGDKYEVSL